MCRCVFACLFVGGECFKDRRTQLSKMNITSPNTCRNMKTITGCSLLLHQLKTSICQELLVVKHLLIYILLLLFFYHKVLVSSLYALTSHPAPIDLCDLFILPQYVSSLPRFLDTDVAVFVHGSHLSYSRKGKTISNLVYRQ